MKLLQNRQQPVAQFVQQAVGHFVGWDERSDSQHGDSLRASMLVLKGAVV